MNTNFTSMIITGCFSAMILVSCESHEQKADDAFERVKEEKMMSKDSNSISKEIIQEPKFVTKNASLNGEVGQENPDEWAKFKMETENKILANENKIKEIKGIPNTNAKLLKKVTFLEKDNNDLRRQMNEYSKEMKSKWENFKAKMNQDVNEIGIQLKDLTINDKI